MHRRLALAVCTAAIGILPAGTAAASGSEGAVTPPKCADVVTSTPPGATSPTPAATAPCWVDEKYPFISEGKEGEGKRATEPSTEPCAIAIGQEQRPCYLTVASMTFKAWNEGRAVTEGPGTEHNKLIWSYNGQRWSLEPTFLAVSKSCDGRTIISAGKGDYWLVNASPAQPGQPWRPLCRFDSESNEWGPVAIPASTAQRLLYVSGSGTKQLLKTRNGAITSGACFAWNNCWFFGSYGIVLHWSEEPPPEGGEAVLALREAGTPLAPGLLPYGEFLAAAVGQAPGGEPFAMAVGANREGYTSPSGLENTSPLQTAAGGEPPAELYTSIGAAFQPVAFVPPHLEEAGNPYDTSLVAVSVDPRGFGWVAGGDPAAVPTEAHSNKPVPAPLAPVSAAGESTCVKPPLFAYAPEQTPVAGAVPGAFLWSSIATIPGTEEAIAGGVMRRTAGEVVPGAPSEDRSEEPVIAQVGCNGTTTLTRFRTTEVLLHGEATALSAPADREGRVTAVAASAPNAAWAATSAGTFASGRHAPPHLYRLTDGEPAEAEAGDNHETRVTHERAPPSFKEEPAPPPAPPSAPTIITTKKTIKLKPAIYDVKSELRTSTASGHVELNLYLTFKLRRSVTVGAHALQGRRVVSVAKPKRFKGRTGTLVLSLSRQHWPTKVTFIS